MDVISLAVAVSKAKSYTDERVVSGSADKGTWDASTNTPTLTQGTGTAGWYYHVSKAGMWDSTSFNVGDTILFDSTKNKWVKISTGNESGTYPIVVKYLMEGDTFPTTRPSGNALVIGDTCAINSAATLPFTIGTITFTKYNDKVAWNGTAWQKETQLTNVSNDLKLYNNLLESLSGTAEYQNTVNYENVTAIRALQESLDDKLSKYKSMPTPSSSFKDLIVLYAGSTTADYVTGRLYQCVEESGIYKWNSLSSSINCDNVTIETNAQGNIQLKDGGITEDKLSIALRSELFRVIQDSATGVISLNSFY